MVKYKIDLNFGKNTFNILGQEIPMYYTTMDQIEELKRQKTRSVNIIYENEILPIEYTVLDCQHKGFLSQIREYRGLPIQAQKRITLKPGFQK